MLTKNAIGNLINRYKAVLKKCTLINDFGSLAVAGLVVAGAGVANATYNIVSFDGSHTLPDCSLMYFLTDTSDNRDMDGKLGDDIEVGGNLVQSCNNLTLSLNSHTLNGNAYKGIYLSTGSVNFTLTGSGTMTSFSSDNGGAIKNTDVLTINGLITFNSNSASNNGGAIYNADNDKVVFADNSTNTFTSNSVGQRGGAIYNSSGQITFGDNSTNKFLSNTSTSSTNGHGGGAIYNISGQITFGDYSTNTFTSNSAEFAGGAISNYDSGKITFGAHSTTDFTSNSARYYGGAIYNNSGQITFGDYSTTKFTSNVANNFDGGAICNKNNGQISFGDNSTNDFTSNVAADGGGAIYNESGQISFGDYSTNTFASNSANKYGGAVYNIGTMTFGTLSNNVFGGGSEAEANTALSGGAIYNKSGQITFGDNSTTNFTSNSSTGTGSTDGGGAIYNAGTVTFGSNTNNTFASNSAANYGGAVYNAGTLTFEDNSENSFASNTATNQGGAIYNSDNSTIKFNSYTTNTFSLNTTTDSAYWNGGGAIYNNGTNAVISFGDHSTNTFNSNKSLGTGGTGNNDQGGGAIYNRYAQIIFGDYSTNDFTSNSATDFGGAIYNDENTGKITFGNYSTTSFTSNSAGKRAGAIYNCLGQIAFGDYSTNKFLSNKSTSTESNHGGGAIASFTSQITFGDYSTNIFTSNSAENRGGAIYNDRASGEVYKDKKITFGNYSTNTFTSNSAEERGGAIYNRSYGQIIFDSNSTNTFISNSAGDRGGAINNTDYGQITFGDNSTNTFGGATETLGNTAKNGGAIYNAIFNNSSGIITFNTNTTNTFSFNKSTGTESTDGGGAIYNQVTLTFSSNSTNTFTSNSAGSSGGAIYNTDYGQITFDSNSTNTFGGFSADQGNTAKNGGAIYNTGSSANITFSSGSLNTFIYNQALAGDVTAYGGAVFNGSNAQLNFSSGSINTFSSNQAQNSGDNTFASGGAIYNTDSGIVNFLPGSINTFVSNQVQISGNNAESYGGAISNIASDDQSATVNFSYGTMNTFSSNKSVFTGDTINSFGGALYSSGKSAIISFGSGSSNTFEDNTSQLGGAISNRSSSSINFSFGSSNSFKGNAADYYGGAISNEALYNEAETGYASTMTFSPGSTNIFEGNTSKYGGALYNYGGYPDVDTTITFSSGSTTVFEGNTATKYGGAVFNGVRTSNYTQTSIIKFAGNVTFSDNTANGTSNDIYNRGTIVISDYVTLGNYDTAYVADTSAYYGTLTFSNGILTANYGNFFDSYANLKYTLVGKRTEAYDSYSNVLVLRWDGKQYSSVRSYIRALNNHRQDVFNGEETIPLDTAKGLVAFVGPTVTLNSEDSLSLSISDSTISRPILIHHEDEDETKSVSAYLYDTSPINGDHVYVPVKNGSSLYTGDAITISGISQYLGDSDALQLGNTSSQKKITLTAGTHLSVQNGDFLVNESGSALATSIALNAATAPTYLTFREDTDFSKIVLTDPSYAALTNNSSTVIFNAGSTFSENSLTANVTDLSKAYSAAVSNIAESNSASAYIGFNGSASFDANTVNLTVSDSDAYVFSGAVSNYTSLSSAGNSASSTLLFADTSAFSGNKAVANGNEAIAYSGALSNISKNTVSDSNTNAVDANVFFKGTASFKNNSAEAVGNSTGTAVSYSGAVFNFVNTQDSGTPTANAYIAFSDAADFSNNTALATANGTGSSKAYGGALTNFADKNIGTANAVIYFTQSANFVSNSASSKSTSANAESYGGAISNILSDNSTSNASATITFLDAASFENNYTVSEGNNATSYGGAVYNNTVSTSSAIIGFHGIANFLGNYAKATGTTSAALGGAIYNSANSVINFFGKTTFSDNKIIAGGNESLNDIYSLGTININKGSYVSLSESGTPGDSNTVYIGTDGTNYGTLSINGGTLVADFGTFLKYDSGTVSRKEKASDNVGKITGQNTKGTIILYSENVFDDNTYSWNNLKQAVKQLFGFYKDDGFAELTDEELVNVTTTVSFDGATLGDYGQDEGNKLVANAEYDASTYIATVAELQLQYKNGKKIISVFDVGINTPTVESDNAVVTAKKIVIDGAGLKLGALKLNPYDTKGVTLSLVNGARAIFTDAKIGSLLVDTSDKAISTYAELSDSSLLTINGDLSGGSLVSVKTADALGGNTFLIQNGGKVKLDTLNFSGGTEYSANLIQVGSDSADKGGDILIVKNLTLPQYSYLILDPAWGQDSSEMAVENIADVSGSYFTYSGRVAIAQNSKLTIGTQDTDWLNTKLKEAGYKELSNSKNGVTAAFGLLKNLDISQGGVLYVDGSLGEMDAYVKLDGAADGSAYFASNSFFAVTPDSAGKTAKTAVLKAKTITVADGAKLYFDGFTEVRNYYVANASEKLTIKGNGWSGSNLYIDDTAWNATNLSNNLFISTGLEKDENSAWISVKAVGVNLPKMQTSLRNHLNQFVSAYGIDTDSSIMSLKFVSRALDRLTADSATTAIEGAAKIAFAGAVPQMSLDLATRTSNALASRDFLSSVPGIGTASGNTDDGFTIWALPTYQYSSGDDFKSANFKSGYDANVGGLALGADYTLNNNMRFGLALNGGGGKVDSTGDFNKTKNDINYFGVNAYASWKHNNFSLFGQFGFLRTDNELSQNTPALLYLSNTKADTGSNVFSAGLRASYQIVTEFLELVPYVELDYYHVHTSGFAVQNGGQTMFNASSFDSDFLQIPIGVNLKKSFAEADGWNFKGALDLAVIPAIGNSKASQDVRLNGLPTNAAVSQVITDNFTGRASVGVEATKGNLGIGLNYTFQGGSHTSNHGIQGMVNWKF